MHSEQKKWSYIREIFNVKCNISPQNLSRAVILCLVPDDFALLIDSKVLQLGGRMHGEDNFMIEVKTVSKVNMMHGDPEGVWRLLPFAMLIIVSPLLKFGPGVAIEVNNNKKKIVSTLYDELYTIERMQLNEEYITIDEGMIEELKRFFQKVIDNWLEDLLVIPKDRFVRACMGKRDDDGIIDLSIAIESLYGSNKHDISCRVASFIGSNIQERERIYSDIAALFWARNKILHEGVSSPNIVLEDGRKLDTKQIFYEGCMHCAQAIKKLLETPFWKGMKKRDVSHHFESLASPLRSEFESYKQKYKSVTKPRNP